MKNMVSLFARSHVRLHFPRKSFFVDMLNEVFELHHHRNIIFSEGDLRLERHTKNS